MGQKFVRAYACQSNFSAYIIIPGLKFAIYCSLLSFCHSWFIVLPLSETINIVIGEVLNQMNLKKTGLLL